MHKSTNQKKPSRKTAPRLRLVEPPSRVEPGFAIDLLRASVATNVRCLAEVVRRSSSATRASRDLLEAVLEIEAAHAAELVGVLREHRIAR